MHSERPAINPQYTLMQKTLIAASVITLISHFAVVAYYWPSLPPKIAMHYGFLGKPDSWGGKATIWALPVISLAQCLIMLPLSLIPRSYNYPYAITAQNAPRQYSLGRSLILAVNFEITVLFSHITWATVRVAFGHVSGIGTFFVAIMLATLGITVGIFFYKARIAR